MAAAVLKKSGSSLTTDSPPFNPRIMVGGGNISPGPPAPVFRANPFANESDNEHSNAIPKHTFEYNG